MNGYLEHGTWYGWNDKPIRKATRRERIASAWLARKRRRGYRHLAHVLIVAKRSDGHTGRI